MHTQIKCHTKRFIDHTDGIAFEKLKTQFHDARHEGTRDINIHGARTKAEKKGEKLSTRQLMAAEIQSRAETLTEVEVDLLNSNAELLKEAGWVTTGKNGQFGARFWLIEEQTTTKGQFMPTVSQPGNAYIAGVGRYDSAKGAEKSILHLIDALTEAKCSIKKRENEQLLARLMLDALHSGKSLCKHTAKDFKISKSDVPKYNKLFDLIRFLEPARRHGKGARNLPIGFAILFSLELIKEGHLSFKHIFDKDTAKDSINYSVWAGDGINTAGSYQIAKEKMKALCRLYQKKVGIDSTADTLYRKVKHRYDNDSNSSATCHTESLSISESSEDSQHNCRKRLT